MNTVLWIAQIILAAVFLVSGVGKILAYEHLMGTLEARSKGLPAGIPRGLAAFIGLAEVAGAIGVLVPGSFSPDHFIVRLAAAGLALIMVLAGIYHLRRRDSAAPAVTLFLLALFIIVGRWPR
jgi:uncharacterized membrane protein YphA (DoxX/SURF4 family)